MAVWAKIKIFYAGRSMLGASGSTLTATSTASGSSVNNIYSMLEINNWTAANTTTPHYISFDGGSGKTYTANVLAIIGHNLFSCGATQVDLQYSDDNFSAHAWTALTFTPTTDGAIWKEFTSPGAYRYWRLAITAPTSAPHMTICLWGNKTELDYCTASFDPHAEEVVANVNRTEAGYVAGVHVKSVTRAMSLRFDDADAALYADIRAWWDTNGLQNFFVVWETANYPTDIFLMMPEAGFSAPMTNGGFYRSVSINLKGRKE